ncbi:hypothetical protein CISIN_1g036147mg, partial [Citrus sinensis]
MTLSSTMLHRHAICLCRMTSSSTTTPPRNTVAVPTLHHLNDQVSADQLSIQIDSELSQSNFQSTKYSLLAYSCGHLHTRFGKNLKRHRCMDDNFLSK